MHISAHQRGRAVAIVAYSADRVTLFQAFGKTIHYGPVPGAAAAAYLKAARPLTGTVTTDLREALERVMEDFIKWCSKMEHQRAQRETVS